jgi:hypothetical protein
MSEENVEAVRQGYAGFAENGVEGVIPFFTEDAVIYSIPEWPDDPEYDLLDDVPHLSIPCGGDRGMATGDRDG